jgi:hypothetical protein
MNSIGGAKITLPQKGKFKEYAVLKMIGGIGLVAFGTFLGGKRAIYCATHANSVKKDYADDPWQEKKRKTSLCSITGIGKLHLFFIPVIPVLGKNYYVGCIHCKQCYKLKPRINIQMLLDEAFEGDLRAIIKTSDVDIIATGD